MTVLSPHSLTLLPMPHELSFPAPRLSAYSAPRQPSGRRRRKRGDMSSLQNVSPHTELSEKDGFPTGTLSVYGKHILNRTEVTL